MATSTTSLKPNCCIAFFKTSGVTLGPNCPINAGATAAIISSPALIA